MVFYHPKKYKELHGITSRKCNTRQRAQGSLPANGALNSDQVISDEASTEATSVHPGPGLKVSSAKHQASRSNKRQASSFKAFEPTCSIAKRQASQPE